MNKKLFTQIKNEKHSNLWLVLELLLVSVVMWYIVDYLYVTASIYREPRGFDISHCYLIEMGQLTDKSSDYIPNDTLIADEVNEVITRLQHRPEVEAVSLSRNSFPYNGSNSGMSVRYDTLQTSFYCVGRIVTPDFLRVFRYEGIRGETPDELASMLTPNTFLASDNLYQYAYGIPMTSLVGKEFYIDGDTTRTRSLAASLKPVRYYDYQQGYYSYSSVAYLPPERYLPDMELCVRVKANMDKNFIERLREDSEKQFRVGNVFIGNITSFADIRRNFQQAETAQIRNMIFGMGFLLLNIFLGLLGTFWFRTQQRRSEIALYKAFGCTNRGVFRRLLTEGVILLVVATVPAVIVDWNIAYAGLASWMNGTTLELVRFLVTTAITFVLMVLMIMLGTFIPARKAMMIDPAEALHEE